MACVSDQQQVSSSGLAFSFFWNFLHRNKLGSILLNPKQLYNCNYVLFNKLPWPGYSEGTFRSSSQAATCPPVYHKWQRLYIVPLIAERSFNCPSMEAENTDFYSLWLNPIRNRTPVCRFRSRRSIHSTTDRCINWNPTICEKLMVIVVSTSVGRKKFWV